MNRARASTNVYCFEEAMGDKKKGATIAASASGNLYAFHMQQYGYI